MSCSLETENEKEHVERISEHLSESVVSSSVAENEAVRNRNFIKKDNMGIASSNTGAVAATTATKRSHLPQVID